MRHKQPFWVITDVDDRIRSAYERHRYHETADEQYGAEALETLSPTRWSPCSDGGRRPETALT
ncbi:hypothetical protein [Halohasta litchfieldiae]|jgi:hypothetical protein